MRKRFGRQTRLSALALFLMTILLLAPATPAMAQNSAPIVDAGPDQNMVTEEIIVLQGSATDPNGDAIVGWLWSVESQPAGSSPTIQWTDEPDPLFFTDLPGDYVLSLTATDGLDWGEPDYVTIHVRAIEEPQAIIIADVTEGPAPLTVHFDGSTSTVDPVAGELTYDWSFGDGTRSAEISPIHVYDLPGNYLATLRVFDELGQTDQDSIEITVTVNQPPVANAGGDRDVYTNYGITLLGSATDPDGDAIVAWQWSLDSQPAGSFADLNPLTSPNTVFFADTPGDYVVSLVAYDGTDWSLPDTATITVTDNLPPVAVISADVVSGPAPLTVHFDGTGSYDPEGAELDWHWRFGPEVSYEPTPTHMFMYSGVYTVTLRVTDDLNQFDEDVILITVVYPTAELWAVEYQWGDPPPGYNFDGPIFEGWQEVRIENRGEGDAFNVTATITDQPANVTIVDGDVTVGDIPDGSSAWSTDTFTIQVDTANPVDPCEGITWRIDYDDIWGYHHVIENVPEFPPGEGPCD